MALEPRHSPPLVASGSEFKVSGRERTGLHSAAAGRLVVGLSAILIEMMVVLVIHPPGVLALLYFLLVTLILYPLLLRRTCLEPLLLYALYSFFAMGLYFLQCWSLPQYIGFSGGLGVGTDDAFFYSQVAASIPPVFSGMTESYGAGITSFSRILRFVSLYPVTHPFDILFFTAMTTVFIPTFTREVALMLSGQERVGRLAFKLAAFCPFLLSNSLILVRDGSTAALFMGAIYCFLKRRYVALGLLGALLFYIRIASGLQLVFALSFFALLQLANARGAARKLFYVLVVVVVGSVATWLFYPVVYTYLESKHIIVGKSFFRAGYVTRVLVASAKATSTADSLLLTIYQQSPLIRIPLGFAYFLIFPVFVPNRIIRNGIFIPRSLLENVSAILLLFYFKYFAQGVVKAWKDKNLSLRVTIYAYLGLILALSLLSLQFRHKVMFLPLFYVIVAYGYYNRTRLGVAWGSLGSFALATVQMLRTLVRFLQ